MPDCGKLPGDNAASFLPATNAPCVLSYVGCHDRDTDSDRCDDAAASSLSEEKFLPSLCGDRVGSVTVADVYVADSSPREKLLPSLHDADLNCDRCGGLADTEANDAQPQQKLLPSSASVSSIAEADVDAANASLQEKLPPSVYVTNLSNSDDCVGISDSQPPQEKLLPALSAAV